MPVLKERQRLCVAPLDTRYQRDVGFPGVCVHR
jgi:hypothetical protein